MLDIIRRAIMMGATDADIARWLERPLVGHGATPLKLVAEGQASIVLDALSTMDEGVFG